MSSRLKPEKRMKGMIEYIKTLVIIGGYLAIAFLIVVVIPILVWSFIETFFLEGD